MTRAEDLIAAIAALQPDDLETWVRDELIAPHREAGSLVFSEMQCARVRLICTLHYELEIDAASLPLVLSLVDQLYDTRQRLLLLASAVTTQDKTVQEAILAALSANEVSTAAK